MAIVRRLRSIQWGDTNLRLRIRAPELSDLQHVDGDCIQWHIATPGTGAIHTICFGSEADFGGPNFVADVNEMIYCLIRQQYCANNFVICSKGKA